MKQLLFAFFVFCLINTALPALGQIPTPSRTHIEIFAEGKRYPSVHAYKLIQLKREINQQWQRQGQGQDFFIFIEQFLREIPDETMERFERSEIRTAILEFYRLHVARAEQPQNEVDTQVTQMQEMIKDYFKEKDEAQNLTIDPAQMKTIVISPSK